MEWNWLKDDERYLIAVNLSDGPVADLGSSPAA
jgi:hypothetical protein